MEHTLQPGSFDDWYVIEPHYGTGQPEGTRAEWEQIIAAMQRGEGCNEARRCAVRIDVHGNAHFWSPRNSLERDEATVMKHEIAAWCETALGVLKLSA